MEWIEIEKQKPTAGGQYWVYFWREGMKIECVGLWPYDGGLSVLGPTVGVDCEDLVKPETITHWMGPLNEPQPPTP